MRKVLLGMIAAALVAAPVLTIAPAANASAVPSVSQHTFFETRAQQQARLMARDYLDYTAFSRQGLIQQLKYEGFTRMQAIYGVDHIRVSWYRQAVKMAKNYLEHTNFSRSGLIEQLVYEGFTQSQAIYGVNRAY